MIGRFLLSEGSYMVRVTTEIDANSVARVKLLRLPSHSTDKILGNRNTELS